MLLHCGIYSANPHIRFISSWISTVCMLVMESKKMTSKILGRLFMASMAWWVAALMGSVDFLIIMWLNIALAVVYFVIVFVRKELAIAR